MRIWDPETGDQLRAFNTPSREAEAVVFSPDSQRLVTSVRDRLVVWDTETWQVERNLGPFGRQKHQLEFDSKGRLFVAGEDVHLAVWDIGEQKEVQRFPNQAPWLRFAISPDETLVAAGGQDG